MISILSICLDTLEVQRQTAAYAVVFLLCLFLIERSIFSPRYLRDIPTPGGASWLWGHEKQVFDQSVGLAYTQWVRVLSTHVFKIKAALFKPDIVIVADPFALTHIMQRNIYNYPHDRKAHSEVLRPRIARLLGKSLGWVEGEADHKRMRHLVAPSLSPEAIRRGSPDIFAAAENFANTLENYLMSHNSSNVIRIGDWTAPAALDVIGRFGFGHDFEGGRNQQAAKILGAWRSMVKMGVSNRGFLALMLLRRFYFINYLPLKALRAQGDVRRTIHEGIAQELIRRDRDIEGSSLGNDLLSRLCRLFISQYRKQKVLIITTKEVIARKSNKISLEELKDHISMFIMAGSETTSQTLSYAIWELAKNMRVQNTLRQEIAALPPYLSYDDVQNQMPYLDAIAREIMRLHPAGPYMERVAAKDDVLPLRHSILTNNGVQMNQVFIKAGQTVIIPIYSIGREDAVWGDGDTFRPERWMQQLPSQDILPTGWSKLLVFSDGPRQCLGFRLAIFEFKVTLAVLIRKFEFRDTGAIITNKVATSLQPMCDGNEEDNPMLPIEVKIL